MHLDTLFDRDEPERAPDRRGWLVARILLLTIAATAIGGVLLVFFLYLLATGAFTAWLETGGGIG